MDNTLREQIAARRRARDMKTCQHFAGMQHFVVKREPLNKAHIKEYVRHFLGKLITVKEHDDKRQPAQQELASPAHRQMLLETTRAVAESTRNLGMPSKPPPPPAPGVPPKAPAKPVLKVVPPKPPAPSQPVDKNTPPALIPAAVARFAEHGPQKLVSDFAQLPASEHFQFQQWIKVAHPDIATDTSLNTAQQFLAVVKKMQSSAQPTPRPGVKFFLTNADKAGLEKLGHSPEDIAKMRPEEGHAILKDKRTKDGATPQEVSQGEKFASYLDAQPEGMKFVLPEAGHAKNVGTWEKTAIAGRHYWKKGNRYVSSSAFAGHEDIVRTQVDAGGVKDKKSRSVKEKAAPIKPFAAPPSAPAEQKKEAPASAPPAKPNVYAALFGGFKMGEALLKQIADRLQDPKYANDPEGAVAITGDKTKQPLFEQVVVAVAKRGYTDLASLKKVKDIVDLNGHDKAKLAKELEAAFPQKAALTKSIQETARSPRLVVLRSGKK